MKVYFDTVGCRLNQAEIESMAGQLRQDGHQILGSSKEADIVVINSCAVTAAAASDSRQKVRQAHNKGVTTIILTGCWATLYPDQAADLEGVSQVVSNLEKMEIPLRFINVDDVLMEVEPIARQPLPGSHKRTRAFIKVQDGCDNACTYCITRLARGHGKSLEKKEILNTINQAVLGGTKEVVLTGVNLGSWGKDLGGGGRLRDLIQYLLDHCGIERMRLSSIEPWNIDESFFKLWRDSRLCPHFHLPLQSGSAAVLRRMARNTTPEKYRNLVIAARSLIPNLAITTDVIVGFPGETDKEFEESLEFISELGFSGGHVFKYSLREGTLAASMPERVIGNVTRERARQVRKVLEKSENEFMDYQIGKVRRVLWETAKQTESGEWILKGLSENFTRIQAPSPSKKWNEIDTVKVDGRTGDVLTGQILEVKHIGSNTSE
jgi:threonylcarbamoyladenosine tRNA methylthiotransferase MtaB